MFQLNGLTFLRRGNSGVWYENYRIEPSQGTHFFQNLTSFGVGYFTVNPFLENDGFFDEHFLNEQPAVFETDYIRHVRFENL